MTSLKALTPAFLTTSSEPASCTIVSLPEELAAPSAAGAIFARTVTMRFDLAECSSMFLARVARWAEASDNTAKASSPLLTVRSVSPGTLESSLTASFLDLGSPRSRSCTSSLCTSMAAMVIWTLPSAARESLTANSSANDRLMSPGVSGVPIIVSVLLVPVGPYAMTLALNPSSTDKTTPRQRSNTTSWPSAGPSTPSTSNDCTFVSASV
mmetsp:Transcript_33378/g.82702  ORF Transcript_33378/g.82702 Transcript_33378/m.82702 type:complete len:211 (-) Transcript_33378:1629-2261(-)